ncbi:MAG TPA: hypothetical protein VMB72_06350 [Acidimicrobiales bacterium]|nr:hypothetical protein [Acidimicrobiales bacterium]
MGAAHPGRPPRRSRRWLGAVAVGAAGGLAAATWPLHAFAATPTVTTPSGPFTDAQTITVSGSGFPDPHADPTGLQILECADPGGSVANLPTDPSTCDGATVNPLPVNTDASGKFTVNYAVSLLTGVHGTSNIECDATNFCVLWVGIDYNQAFTSGPHAFSKPFEIDPSSSTPASTTAPSTAPSTTPTTTATVPGPSAGAAAPAATPTAAGSGSQGSLASTGVPTSLPWVVAVGLALAVLGTLGRRLAGRGLS